MAETQLHSILRESGGKYEGSDFQKILVSVEKPLEHTREIGQRLRKISKDLEASQPVSAKRIKSLAGSLRYWNDKSYSVALGLFFDPLGLLSAWGDILREPEPEPITPEERLLAEKCLEITKLSFRLYEAAKSGAQTPEALDRVIEMIGGMVPARKGKEV